MYTQPKPKPRAGVDLDLMVAEKVMDYTFTGAHRVAYRDGLVHEYKAGEKYREFQPSTVMADAWEVVLKLKADGFNFQFGDSRELTDWHAEIWHGWKHAAKQHGETLPHAICLAALEAVGVQL